MLVSVLTAFALMSLLAGTFDAQFQLGAAAPFGSMEANHRGGISGLVGVGYNAGGNRFELAGNLRQFPGSQQGEYALDNYRLTLAYHRALVQKLDWQLTSGIGADLTYLRRRFGAHTETGSVPGATLTFSYVRSFGHPKFLFQVFGSELLEFGSSATSSTLVPATVLGFHLGVGYEF